ncbi:unnamed protein product [Ostreobium quekettii]|uniref:LysM domain-containing protein n=1 Tax=Ostreobium quekettii TaxID=121088 RepID=A0A8S1IKW4_9CHLO|nr:unnamed protein product [Ostreobium quekettii]
MIDFYNIQFYNQVTSEYDTYEELFEMATGGSNMTALRQIRDGTSFGFPGIPLDKIVLGKPVTSNGVVNTGFVEMTQLSRFLVQAKAKEILPRGFMGWQWFLDIEELDSQWSHVMGSAWTGFPIPPPLPERQGPEIIMLPPPPVGSGQCAGSYTVQSGDSLSKIGRLYPDTIQVGQVLKIPPCDPGVDGGTPEPPAAPTTPGLPSCDDNNDDEEEEDFDDGDDDVNNAAPIVLVPPPAGSGECAALYEVAPGDTLFAIGQMFGLPYQEVFAANTDILPDENTIEVGQVLKIPPCDPGVVSP